MKQNYTSHMNSRLFIFLRLKYYVRNVFSFLSDTGT